MHIDSQASVKERLMRDREYSRDYKRHFSILMKMYEDKGDAWIHDVVQMSMISIDRNRENFRGESTLKTWKEKILRNHAYRALKKDFIERRKREELAKIREDDPTFQDSQDSSSQDSSSQESHERFHNFVDVQVSKRNEITHRQNVFFKLYVYEGYSPDQIIKSRTDSPSRQTIYNEMDKARKHYKSLYTFFWSARFFPRLKFVLNSEHQNHLTSLLADDSKSLPVSTKLLQENIRSVLQEGVYPHSIEIPFELVSEFKLWVDRRYLIRPTKELCTVLKIAWDRALSLDNPC